VSRTGASVAVRHAERADLLEVHEIEQTAFDEPWPFAAFERDLDAVGFLVATREGRSSVLGYVVGTVTPNHGRDIGHVKDIAVRPDARGVGVGRDLIEGALGRLAVAGATVARLEVRESNEAARSLYRDVGFEPARRLPRYYGDGEDAFVMTLDLGPARWPDPASGTDGAG